MDVSSESRYAIALRLIDLSVHSLLSPSQMIVYLLIVSVCLSVSEISSSMDFDYRWHVASTK